MVVASAASSASSSSSLSPPRGKNGGGGGGGGRFDREYDAVRAAVGRVAAERASGLTLAPDEAL